MKKLFKKRSEKQSKKRGRYKDGKHGVRLGYRLRELLAINRLYTAEDISEITGYRNLKSIRSKLSMMKNKKYTMEPLEVKWVKCPDGIKRFGKPGSTKIYK